ncbi:hypothetical protein [Helicobacter cappadocius]|uniref:Uncharacterized protein n=1 Tax=Helicobacter cappadocius TaxID=3063998 RepID=A0AA90PYG1_9HELI|nr:MULTISPECIES: hypothetical protein [unclassified Helicobacter]MDO7252790.1 hypothetical protein [Helicobacter sp. faydin-H75]MDP2538833.1 hypothetical protein [Helicobacter sp. faydin-H76]
MDKENLIKKTAKELGMTYKELGIAIGYSQETISKSASSEKISLPLQKALEMLITIKDLELKIESSNQGLQNDKTRAYDEMVEALKKFVKFT